MYIGDLSEIKIQMMQMNKVLLEKLTVGSKIEGQLMTKDGQLLLDTKAGIKLPISLCQGNVQPGEWLRCIVLSKTDEGIILQVIPKRQELEAIQEPKALVQKVIEDLQLPEDEVTKMLVDGFVEKQLPLERSELIKSFYIHKQIQLPIPVIINLLESKGELKESVLRTFQVINEQGGKSNILKQLGELIQKCELSKVTCEQLVEVLGQDEAFERGRQQQVSQWLEQKEGLTLPQLRIWVMTQLEKKLVTFYETLKVLPESERGQYLREAAEIQKVIKILEEADLSPEIKGSLESLKEQITQINQIQGQGQMYLMPFNYQERTQDVTLYLFKPKKKHPKAQKELYVVIALDMPALEHIEIHLHQIEKELMLGIQVQDAHIQKYLKQHILQLSASLEQLGYTLKQVDVAIKQDTQQLMKQFVGMQGSSSFDYKV